MNESTFGIIPIRKEDGKNMFLLVKSRSGHWGFPKGHPEKGETQYETAERELYEETGIKNVKIVPYPFSETRLSVEPEYTVTKTVVWFIGYVTTSEVRVGDDEIVEYRWLRFDDAYALLSHDETKRVLLDARLYLAKNDVDATITRTA